MGTERYYKYFIEGELNEIITKIGYKIHTFHKEGGEDNNKWFICKNRFPQLIKGFVLGIIFVAIYIIILIFMKQVIFAFNGLNANVLYSLVMWLIIFCGVAFAEEIIFRGYIGGILLGLMRMETKNIWFPLGFHIAWKLFFAYLYGRKKQNKMNNY